MSRVFGEEQELAAPVLQLLELRSLHALAQGDQLRIAPALPDPLHPGHQLAKLGKLGAELVQLGGGGRLVDEHVAGGFIEVVFVLLGVRQPALQLREPARPLGGRKTFEFAEQVVELFPAAAERLADRVRRARETALEHGAGQRDAVLAAPRRLRQELVDVGRHRLVDGVLVRPEFEADGLNMAIRKQASAAHVLQVFLQPPERPGAVLSELEDVAADAAGRLAETVRLGEQVAVEQADEVREPVVVAVMRGGRQKKQTVALLGQTLGELITLRAFNFVLASRRALRVGAAFVRFVDDDEVPPLLPYALADIVLFGVVDG